MKYIAVVILILSALLSGCVRHNKTQQVLAQQGYTDIVTSYGNPYICSEDDFFSTRFKAVSSSGDKVTGVACEGILKGVTLRFN